MKDVSSIIEAIAALAVLAIAITCAAAAIWLAWDSTRNHYDAGDSVLGFASVAIVIFWGLGWWFSDE